MHGGRNTARPSGLWATAAILTVALATLAGPALGREPQNLTAKVKTLTTGLTEFSGRVTSSDPDCVKGRKIKVSTPKQALGSAKTEKDGRFLLTGKSLRPGTDVTFRLKARGDACIPLVATLVSP